MTEIESGSFVASEAMEVPTTLRVLSWNIARGSKLRGIVEFLAAANADVILLQESDRNTRRTNYRNIAREIAHELKRHYVFGWEFEELAQGSRGLPAYTGQATLSRWPLAHSSILRFQRQSNFWRPRWFIPTLAPLQRRRGGRMALFSEVLTPGRSLFTYNLHCESRGSDDLRCSQLQEFLEHSTRFAVGMPMIAAGDFNFDLSQKVAATALASAGFLNPFAALHSPSTMSPSFRERRRAIDWVLLRGPLVAVNAQIHDGVEVSDHYPLSVTVDFSDRRSAT